jgi:leucine dehydrogenase
MAVAVTNPRTSTRSSNPTAELAPGNGQRTGVAPVEFEHEELVIRRGARSGAYCIVAIHSTALGPALGGLRMWRYRATIDGARDALRLARGMTDKAAAAGLDLGGGKGVVCIPPAGLEGARRRGALLDFADLVESLGGRYITAEDVGVSPADLVEIAERTDHVTGLPAERGGSGDPSPITAIGVEAAIRACLQARFGSGGLAGRTVSVIGLGHVGARLARRLATAGCELIVSDIAPGKRELATALGAAWVDPVEATVAECDVLAPCALGGAISADSVARIRASIVCGSANNQLADESLAARLADRGVLYAPDFIANAGGLISVYRDLKGYSRERALELAEGIEVTLARVFELADARGTTPLAAARELARERLEGALRD